MSDVNPTPTPITNPVVMQQSRDSFSAERINALTQSALAIVMVIGGFLLIALKVADPAIGSSVITLVAGYYFSRQSQHQNEKAITTAVNTALFAAHAVPVAQNIVNGGKV